MVGKEDVKNDEREWEREMAGPMGHPPLLLSLLLTQTTKSTQREEKRRRRRGEKDKETSKLPKTPKSTQREEREKEKEKEVRGGGRKRGMTGKKTTTWVMVSFLCWRGCGGGGQRNWWCSIIDWRRPPLHIYTLHITVHPSLDHITNHYWRPIFFIPFKIAV